MDPFIERVIGLAAANVRAGGGPFAAIVVRNGALIASGVNSVVRDNDHTAHAEVVAIREACRLLGGFQLTGCQLYCSCEPCPMCLGAIYWARPAGVRYAATRHEAAAAGFDDEAIYRQLAALPEARLIPMLRIPSPRAGEPFQEWLRQSDKTPY